MDKLTDFLDEVKFRLRNPFFASFILSWLIWNWKIWIGLFWLQPEDLQNLQVANYVEYAQLQLNISTGFYYPVMSAICLILILPIIRNIMEMYQAWALNWGEKEVLRISKTGVISIEKYIEKKNQLQNSFEAIKRAASDESTLLEEKSDLESKLAMARTDLWRTEENLRNLTNDINNSLSAQLFNGTWLVRPGLNGNSEMKISIVNEELYEVLEVNRTDKFGKILFCQNYHGRMTLCFVSNTKSINFFTMRSTNPSYMTGKWNDSKEIEWKKLI